jgi:hypothetical protein
MKLINLAFRVSSVADTEARIAVSEGWRRTALHQLNGEEFLEADFAGMRVNFFENAIYDKDARPEVPAGFLHVSVEVPNLDEMLAAPSWRDTLLWGPAIINGGFGHRRIAFFEPIPGCRIELMENLGD